MSTPLLVLTSDIPFGELIRQNLEETGRFVVRVTMEQEAAVAFARELKPPLAFLDTSLSEADLLKTGKLLRKANPDIIFVIVSQTGWHTGLDELSPGDYLSKPFYLPDLLEMMDQYFHPARIADQPVQTSPVEVEGDNLPWLTDVNRAAQHLTRLTLESSAQAALINRNDQLWSYAGQLPQPAANELAEAVSRYWDRQEENDLVRFLKLESTDAEHMLYATRLAEGMVLALIFDAETPFSTIRSQATHLAHSLSASPADDAVDNRQSEPEIHPGSLSGILTDIPAPNPPRDSIDYSGGTRASYEVTDEESPDGVAPSSRLHFDEYRPSDRVGPLIDTEQRETPLDNPDRQVAFRQNPRRTDPGGVQSDQIEKTQPIPLQRTHKIVLEPVSAAVYNLDYACLLLPRFPHHYLTGDILDRLGEWVPQVCIAFGWRLEYISIRPDYLQWIVSVPPVTSPGNLMRILRQHTSVKIFEDFPRFKEDNPSGDFWAPGYLIMGGSQPAPAQLIKDFIAQTRQRQGFSPQNRH